MMGCPKCGCGDEACVECTREEGRREGYAQATKEWEEHFRFATNDALLRAANAVYCSKCHDAVQKLRSAEHVGAAGGKR